MEKVIGRIKKSQSNFLFGEKFNLSESYTSLLLGVVVVIAAAMLFVSFVRGNRNDVVIKPLQTEKISQELQKTKQEVVKGGYTVVAGDTLWSIAVKNYNSGYEWPKIAQANKLSSPYTIEIGTKLAIPTVTQAILATNTVLDNTVIEKQTHAISGEKYTIKEGDSLWAIAIRAYGDGFRWVDIARVNNLQNPDIIYIGNDLKIPR